MRYHLYSNLSLPKIHQERFIHRPIERFADETDLFPQPGEEFYPVLPENLLYPFCQQAKKTPAFLVQCADYSHTEKVPQLMSEQQALQLARQHKARLFHDSIANASYFCYSNQQTQHIVWVEDGFHLLKKLQKLGQKGIGDVALLINQNNLHTLLSLMPFLT